MNKSFTLSLAAVAIIALGIGIAAQKWLNPTPEFTPKAVMIWPKAIQLKEFSLTDHQQQPFTLEQLKGKWHLFFLGYTHCPDVCPTTMLMLNEMVKQLPEHVRQQLQVVFLAVDPDRDVEQLKPYVEFYNPDFMGVSGELKEIYNITFQFSLPIAQKSGDGENYLVDHSSALVLINPMAQKIATISSPHDAADIAHDLSGLIK